MTFALFLCLSFQLMVYASEYADFFQDSRGFGWEAGQSPRHSWSHFMDGKRKELQRLNGAYKNTLANAKVTLLEGRGKVVGPHLVEVDGKTFRAKNILIVSGSL